MASTLLVVGLAACSSPAARRPQASADSGRPVVRPAAVDGLLARTMARNNRANARLDAGLLSSYEAGSAFAIDAGTYEGERRAEKATGYHPPNAPFTLRRQLSALQREPAWPVQLLTGGRTVAQSRNSPAGPACDSLLDFEKTGPAAPWKIVLEPGLGPSLPPVAMRGGYAAPVRPSAVRAADGLPAKVAQALLHFETTGNLGPFQRSYFTGSCWQLPNPRLDLLNAESAGFAARDLFSPLVPADTSVFALRGGATLAIFTLSFKDELIAASPSAPVAWRHTSLRKDPSAAFTYLLPAGNYLQVDQKGELEVAAVLSPSHASYRLVGDYYGFTSVTGSKASSHPTTTVPGATLAAAQKGASG